MNPYHYTECGLDNIIIEADLIAIDDQGEEIVTIPAIGQLHNTIAQGQIIRKMRSLAQKFVFCVQKWA